jgi:hypothetical protein
VERRGGGNRLSGVAVDVRSPQALAALETMMSEEPLNPGDEAAPGTPGTGEDVCPKCNGSGQLNDAECENCGGTGKVIRGIGGA